MIWSTTWPQERPGFYYWYFSLVFINLRKGQNQEKKLVDVCWWRHTSLISSFHAARIPTCGCQMYRDDLFWSRCQSWNIIKKMYKKNHKKKKIQTRCPRTNIPCPHLPPTPSPYTCKESNSRLILLFSFCYSSLVSEGIESL